MKGKAIELLMAGKEGEEAFYKKKGEILQGIADEFMKVMNSASTIDLPFYIATMKLLSAGLENELPPCGKQLAKNLLKGTEVINEAQFEKFKQGGRA